MVVVVNKNYLIIILILQVKLYLKLRYLVVVKYTEYNDK